MGFLFIQVYRGVPFPGSSKNNNILMKLIFSLFAAVLLFVFLQSCNKGENGFKNRIFQVVSSPEEVGFDATRLQRIDTFFQTYVDKGILPNGISFVAKDGKIVHFKAYGWRDREAGIVLKKDDIFRLASQTKAITTVGLMILLEKGLLGLDEPVSKYIPEFANPQVLVSLNEKDTSWTSRPSRSEILIRHLLNHTSGIGEYFYGINGENPRTRNPIYEKYGVPGDRSGATLKEVIPKLAKLPLLHEPGAAWTYGLSTDVVGCLIEIISGKSLDDYLRAEVFDPLGMNDTYFNIPDAKKDRLVKLYKKQRYDSPLSLSEWGQKAIDVTYFSGAGGLYGTIEDYAKFCQMLLNQGNYNGAYIVSRKSVEIMSRNQIDNLEIWNGDKFGYGFEIFTEKGLKDYLGTAGSFRWAGMFSTDYLIDPTENLIYVNFTNIYPNAYVDDVYYKYRNLVYQALK